MINGKSSLVICWRSSVKNENARLIYENDDIIVMHSIGTFPNGSRDAVMYVGLKRDGKIYKSETGSTPIPYKP